MQILAQQTEVLQSINVLLGELNKQVSIFMAAHSPPTHNPVSKCHVPPTNPAPTMNLP